MSSVQNLLIDAQDVGSIWEHNVEEKTFMELHRYRIMRWGFLMGFQEAMDIMSKDNAQLATATVPCMKHTYEHNERVMTIMKNYKNKLVELHCKLNEAFERNMDECVEQMQCNKEN